MPPAYKLPSSTVSKGCNDVSPESSFLPAKQAHLPQSLLRKSGAPAPWSSLWPFSEPAPVTLYLFYFRGIGL